MNSLFLKLASTDSLELNRIICIRSYAFAFYYNNNKTIYLFDKVSYRIKHFLQKHIKFYFISFLYKLNTRKINNKFFNLYKFKKILSSLHVCSLLLKKMKWISKTVSKAQSIQFLIKFFFYVVIRFTT